jgi:hypothetical protein
MGPMSSVKLHDTIQESTIVLHPWVHFYEKLVCFNSGFDQVEKISFFLRPVDQGMHYAIL